MTSPSRLTELPNGLRVVSQEMPHLQTLAIGVWVDVGARHETVDRHGISHMLEHMAFKGTTRRSALDLAQQIEDVGGFMNAYTSREQTAYYIRILKDDLPLAVDILSDILLNSTFAPEEIERERGVVIQEIGQSLDTPDDIVFDYLQETAFSEQAMGRTILGTEQSVSSFDQSVLKRYMSARYGANRMVVSAAGNVNHDEFVERVGDHLGDFQKNVDLAFEPAIFVGGDRRDHKDLEQAHMALALDGMSYRDEDYYALQVLISLLGGGMSSRLFQEVREKRGLCYSIYAFGAAYHDAGLLGIYAGTGGHQIHELTNVIAEVVGSLSTSLTEEEVVRAKTQMNAGLMMGLESPAAWCEQLGRHVLMFGHPIPPAELLEKVARVDAAQVRRVADRLSRSRKLALAAIGPINELESPDQIAAKFG